MLRGANRIADDYASDQNVIGVLIRKPIPDDPDFPQTCDVELALVVNDLRVASERGYVLARRTVQDVLIDVCAVSKEWLLTSGTPVAWLLSLGDPRAFEVFRDYGSGELTRLFPIFMHFHLGSAAFRVSNWLAEAKIRLDAAMNLKLNSLLRMPEAAFSLVYLTCALLDSTGRSFGGSLLKLPRNLRLVNDQLADELREYFPAADKDPLEAARRMTLLANQLSLEYPQMAELDPREAAEVKYNLSPLEVEYRSFVTGEIAGKDKLTALWYVRAWGTYLISHCGAVLRKVKGSYALPPRAFSIWREILGNPDEASIGLFVDWVDELYGLCVEGCQELGIPMRPIGKS
jgi:hypothetical protein